ncbi:hypothetical protein H0H92_015245, partial [Tricholoma furcatifolium]
QWDDTKFKKVSLASLGFRVQLGHGGQPCVFSRPAHKDLLIFHTNGIHSILVDYCGCNADYSLQKQMMDVAWFPATPLEPQTCATFSLLHEFHALNLQGKVSGYDFYKTLVHLTDGSGLRKLPDRLQQFMLIIREWRHLKMAKRAGRGHDPSGIAGTRQGGLAIDCRACPHPNINLPPGWEDAPPDVS